MGGAHIPTRQCTMFYVERRDDFRTKPTLTTGLRSAYIEVDDNVYVNENKLRTHYVTC